MSKRSDQHEIKVAAALDSIPGVVAIRPVAGTDFSDVKINFNGTPAWLEVKMNHSDNLANPRVYYHAKTWKSRYSTPVAGYIVQELNKSEHSLEFVSNLTDYAGLSLDTVYIPTLRSEMETENAVPRDTMRKYCKSRGGYIIDYQDKPLGHIVTEHYIKGKTEPAHYMQAGDDFYRISNTDPLGLGNDIPLLDGTGKFRVRVSNRSKFYEVQAEIKMRNLIESDYSVLPGTKKKNPFTLLSK